MEGLFDSGNKQDVLFQDKKKTDKKKIFKIILVILLVLVLLSGTSYGVFYYLTQVKNRDAKVEIIELSKNINLDEYTDLNGLSAYFDNINNNSYEFNTEIQANSHKYNNMLKDKTENEDVNLKAFKLLFNGKVNKNSNKLQTDVDLKYNDNTVIDFQIQDTGDQILLYGKNFFQEHIGIEKDKMKNLIIKEYGLESDIANSVEQLTDVSLDTNYIKQSNELLNSVLKSLPTALSILEEDNFEIQRNVKVNYRNNSLNAETYILNMNYKDYVNFIVKLKNLSKIEANNVSIEIPNLVGKTDDSIDAIISYFTQILNVKQDESISINAYRIKNKLAKIDFIKNNETSESEMIFEIEFIEDKNSKEMLISNQELNLKITLTKDNSKIYTKIDIDGKIPIPSALDFEESIVTEVNDSQEKEESSEEISGESNEENRETTEETPSQESNENADSASLNEYGQRNLFTTEAPVAEPLVVQDEDNAPDMNTGNQENNIPGSTEDTNANTQEAPVIDFVEDLDSIKLDESIITQKLDLKANISFERPLNNSSMMNFNIMFVSNEVEVNAKANIMIKDNVDLDNPMKVILLTTMEDKRLKDNLKAINNRVYQVFLQNLKSLKIIK